MSNKNRTVYRRNDGAWVNKRNDSDRASSVHTTQKDAENVTRAGLVSVRCDVVRQRRMALLFTSMYL